MTASEAMGNFALILEDVCGPGCELRERAISSDEWDSIVERVQTMAAMNKQKEKANVPTSKAVQS